MMNENFFGKEVMIIGDVEYIGDGDNPKDCLYIQAHKKALEDIRKENDPSNQLYYLHTAILPEACA